VGSGTISERAISHGVELGLLAVVDCHGHLKRDLIDRRGIDVDGLVAARDRCVPNSSFFLLKSIRRKISCETWRDDHKQLKGGINNT